MACFFLGASRMGVPFPILLLPPIHCFFEIAAGMAAQGDMAAN